MKKTWEREYTLRTSDFNKYGHIHPSAVLDLFQDAAGQHGEELGVGFSSMLERSYLWVMVRVRFNIVNEPQRHQTVCVRTWPLEPSRIGYRREYCICDTEGNVLIAGSSDWVVIDSVSRKLVSAPDLYPFSEGFHDELMFEGRSSKIREFDTEGEKPHTVSAEFTELDFNNHVNNTKYANYVMNAINPGAEDAIKGFQMDYRKEVAQGTVLDIYHIKQEGKVLVKGVNADNETMFICEIVL